MTFRLLPDEPLPRYAFVPGGAWPHPESDPAGHAYGKARPTPSIDPAIWPSCSAYLRGLDLLNAGFPWEAHVEFESLWLACGRKGEAADYFKAWVKLAAAVVKRREGLPDGATGHAAACRQFVALPRRHEADLVRLRPGARCASCRSIRRGRRPTAADADEDSAVTKAELAEAAGRLVPDVIAENLDVLFVGINPGLYSAAIGHHFGRPGNRFWPALHASGFTPRRLSPFEEHLLPGWGLGITNLAARASARADELSRDELLEGADDSGREDRAHRPACGSAPGHRIVSRSLRPTPCQARVAGNATRQRRGVGTAQP